MKTAPCSSSPALFRAKNKHSSQKIFFHTPREAYEWMLTHRDWTLAKREVINWTFPLERIISEECWVKIEEFPISSPSF